MDKYCPNCKEKTTFTEKTFSYKILALLAATLFLWPFYVMYYFVTDDYSCTSCGKKYPRSYLDELEMKGN